MSKYKKITQKNYCIEKEECICLECNFDFYEEMPYNNELVKFKCGDGINRYLPIYNEYGYLFLLQKILKKWNPSKPILESDMMVFEEKLSEITPYGVKIDSIICPHCGSNHLKIMHGEVVLNPTIEWIEIDIEKIN